MKMKIIETRDLDKSTICERARLIRIVDIDGVRYLQMQGRKHEIMSATWEDGVIMTCPSDLKLDIVEESPELYYRGYGAGCEMLEDIPAELTH